MCNALVTVAQDRAGNGYQVDLQLSVHGVWPDEPVASCALPADLDVGDVPAVLAGDGIRDAICEHLSDHPESQDLAAIGVYLGRLLFRDDVLDCWQQAGPERTFLRIEPPELRLLPWELMNSGVHVFIKKGFVRVRHPMADTEMLMPPVRVLVVVGEEDSGIGTDMELRAVKKVLVGAEGRIEAEFLFAPSQQELLEVYGRVAPHVFHFIGHGDRMAADDEPALMVGPDRWPLTAEYIRNALEPAPRVAILNACRSGQVEDVRALTDAFLDCGAGAVLGMQGDIRGQAAALFGGKLYEQLAAKASIDRAVAQARRAVFAATGSTHKARDWVLPSLTLQCPPDQVLAAQSPISPEDLTGIDQRLRSWVQTFVNRVEERHQLAAGIDPEPGARPSRVLLLVGDADTGKSSLLHWLRRRCALRGRRVRYVDLKGDSVLDYLQTLYAIRDQGEDIPRLAPAAAAAFDRFNYDLTFIEKGMFPEEPSGELRPPSVPPSPPSPKDGAVDLVKRVFQSFREALCLAAADRPLILILDHLDGVVANDLQKYLLPELVRFVVLGEIPNVRLVIALTREEHKSFWPLDGGGLPVDVGLINHDKFQTLAEDLMLALGESLCAEDQDLIRMVAPRFTGGGKWSPTRLRDLIVFIEKGRAA
ncbi:MAG: CHAT domain-containing protein [Kibdelosporangium sp.]